MKEKKKGGRSKGILRRMTAVEAKVSDLSLSFWCFPFGVGRVEEE